MHTIYPTKDTFTCYDRKTFAAAGEKHLEVNCGFRSIYLAFSGTLPWDAIESAKLRLHAEHVPDNSRLSICILPGYDFCPDTFCWNTAPLGQEDFLVMMDVYPSAPGGWYEADISQAFAGVHDAFAFTVCITAETCFRNQSIRFHSLEADEFHPHICLTSAEDPACAVRLPEGEDGYELWLRYQPLTKEYLELMLPLLSEVHITSDRFQEAIRYELELAIPSMAGLSPSFSLSSQCGLSLIETTLLDEGSYRLSWNGCRLLVEGGGAGILYGMYALLSKIQREIPLSNFASEKKPHFKNRIFGHWDDFYQTIERGYAGTSLWHWLELPDTISPRYQDYARVCASIAINGLVLNNVNPDTAFLEDTNLPRIAALADIFRRYGIKIFLSVSFDTPLTLGHLETANPDDTSVSDFWKQKLETIYQVIPDFGGFSVKGDSEGQPGPMKYGKTHAAGANLFARLLKPYGGLVLWRAFVYRIPGLSSDRACQAYEVFQPLDGQFEDNVILQIKNGPLDFMTYEPVSPLFSAMPRTTKGIEVQAALEYKGQSTHMCFVPQEIQHNLLHETGNGTVKDICRQFFLAVTNTGSDRNWTRSIFNQANLFGCGRLAFEPDLDLREMAVEWACLTFSCSRKTAETIADMLLRSYDTYASYTTPLGLGFLCDTVTHFHPQPEIRSAFNGCTEDGAGYDRTSTGSGFINQYHSSLADYYSRPDELPLHKLLWFHHLPYTFHLEDGKTLIQALYNNYFDGVLKVRELIGAWQALQGSIDEKRFRIILRQLTLQLNEAIVWRNNCVDYFYKKSGIPDEKGRYPRPSLSSVEDCMQLQGTLYLLDAGYAVSPRYLSKAQLELAADGVNGIKLTIRDDQAQSALNPDLIRTCHAFFLDLDGFLYCLSPSAI